MTETTLDAITLEIVWTRLRSTVDAAAATFVRTAFSSLVREANDYAVVLTDRDGRSVMQSAQSLPSFLSTTPATVKAIIERFERAEMQPRDAFMTNDPWLGTGHLNDITTVVPLFHSGYLVGFAGVASHMPDIGGRLRSASNVEIYEEGLQLPPCRLFSGGEIDQVLENVIRANVRTPDETMGDLFGQFACCQTLQDKLSELLDEISLDFTVLANEVIARTEGMMRSRINALPDGTYSYEIENDAPLPQDGGRVRLCCEVTVRGDTLSIDFAGSSGQVPLGINTPLAYTKAYSVYAIKAALAPEIPNNEGAVAPLEVNAPNGSILNPGYPAACGARAMIGHLLPPVILGALANILPDRMPAPPGSPTNTLQLVSAGRGPRFALTSFISSGMGASANRPGDHATHFPSNLANSPIEMQESAAPIRILRRSLRSGSGGRGRQPGGEGMVFEFVITGDHPVMASVLLNRVTCAAPGLFGGSAGAPAQMRVNGETAEASRQIILQPGDYVLIETGGGGGYGEPDKGNTT